MNHDEMPLFAEMMTGMAAMYSREMAEMQIHWYWNALHKHDFQTVQNAIERHMKSDRGSYMPLIADLCQMLEGRSDDRAGMAWTKFDNAVRTVGPYHDVIFDDPLIHVVVQDMGGWIYLCGKDDKEWPFIANDFKKRFGALSNRQERPQHAPVLTGIANAQNGVAGRELALPVMIGRVERAERVRLAGTEEPHLKITRPEDRPNIAPLQLKGRK